MKDVPRAAAALREGKLVAFPTETVYGLGADAGNERAVLRIFTVKGRPTKHPLIVHFADPSHVSSWAAEVPAPARKLAEHFWPGPLTLVLRRSKRVPDVVTGGLETVALRVPAHPMAAALLREFGGGVAAPSANRFGSVSPTTADHVRADLGKDVDLILDGGPCAVGVESTIVDLSSGEPAILRPGGVTCEDLERVIGHPVPVRSAGLVRVPGQMETHYAPKARVVIVASDELEKRAEEMKRQGIRAVVLSLSGAPDGMARELYARLRKVDQEGFEAVLVALPSEEGLGLAVADRLRRAAGPGNIMPSGK